MDFERTGSGQMGRAERVYPFGYVKTREQDRRKKTGVWPFYYCYSAVHFYIVSKARSISAWTNIDHMHEKMARSRSLRRATAMIIIFLITLFVLVAFAPPPSASEHHSSQFRLDEVSPHIFLSAYFIRLFPCFVC